MTYEEYLATSRGEHYLFGWTVIAACSHCPKHVEYFLAYIPLGWAEILGSEKSFMGVDHVHCPKQYYNCVSCEEIRQCRLVREHKALWEKQRAHNRR
jgi:hypothetical protein